MYIAFKWSSCEIFIAVAMEVELRPGAVGSGLSKVLVAYSVVVVINEPVVVCLAASVNVVVDDLADLVVVVSAVVVLVV